jgi:hypothetical protein
MYLWGWGHSSVHVENMKTWIWTVVNLKETMNTHSEISNNRKGPVQRDDEKAVWQYLIKLHMNKASDPQTGQSHMVQGHWLEHCVNQHNTVNSPNTHQKDTG